MAESSVSALLAEAASEVLETMFFAGVEGCVPPEEARTADSEWARVAIRGEVSGEFLMCITPPAARRLAADFAGTLEKEALSEAQVFEVVCELANMICGSTLSRVNRGGLFELSKPERAPEAPGAPWDPDSSCGLRLDEGALAARLTLDVSRA